MLFRSEPLSALDRKMREQMQVELIRLQRQVGITFILVTHDQEEALVMSDRIAVMFEGEIGQMDDPETLYRRPKSKRVAAFIGLMNFLPARVGEEVSRQITARHAPQPGFIGRVRGQLGFRTPGPKALPEYELGVEVEVPGLGTCLVPLDRVPRALRQTTCTVGIRPETLAILFESEQTPRRVVPGVVDEVVYYGDMTYYDVKIDGVDKPLTISMKNLIGRPVLDVGARTEVAWDERSLVLLAG